MKRLSDHAKAKSVKSPKLDKTPPKRGNVQNRVSKRSKAAQKKEVASAATKSGILEGTRRRIRRNPNVAKVDFAQSP